MVSCGNGAISLNLPLGLYSNMGAQMHLLWICLLVARCKWGEGDPGTGLQAVAFGGSTETGKDPEASCRYQVESNSIKGSLGPLRSVCALQAYESHKLACVFVYCSAAVLLPSQKMEEVNYKLPLSNRWSQTKLVSESRARRGQSISVPVTVCFAINCWGMLQWLQWNKFAFSQLTFFFLGTFLCNAKDISSNKIFTYTSMKVSWAVIYTSWASDLCSPTCWIPWQHLNSEGAFCSCRRWRTLLMVCHKEFKPLQGKVLHFKYLLKEAASHGWGSLLVSCHVSLRKMALKKRLLLLCLRQLMFFQPGCGTTNSF